MIQRIASLYLVVYFSRRYNVVLLFSSKMSLLNTRKRSESIEEFDLEKKSKLSDENETDDSRSNSNEDSDERLNKMAAAIKTVLEVVQSIRFQKLYSLY